MQPYGSPQSLGSPTNHIIGGSPADIADFPYQCSLRYSGSHTCGCVILTKSKILTAAHCVDGRTTSSFSVYAGSTSRTEGGVLRSVLSQKVHENYNDGSATFANDVAVMTLSGTFDLGDANIEAAVLSRSDDPDYAGDDCILTGWGRTSSSNTLPDDLMKVTTTGLSRADCQSAMSAITGVNIQNMHLCVMTAGKDGGSCNGDSGGPMQCRGKIAGVTSWGISSSGNCLTTYPSVYARVGHFYDWISNA
ncbi:fibrinolytic enzyme, isozyme C-like [Gigantopelta aegis]|uniref:fibrinolytic enzyme, isozyme C-like n=1 Tax=Gigantopelta aegis TaxID=1735272 RepID=UPI001B887544|nr:fibrinolytic enzyme, isozyme C-like [Gigantopelta aegis]